jgi:hypothetical protein
MVCKKLKTKFPTNSLNNNTLKVFMAHKKDMGKSNLGINKPYTSIKKISKKNSFIMEHRKLNKIPQRAIVAFVKKSEFMDLITNTLNEINKSNSNRKNEEVWDTFKEELTKINDGNEDKKLEYDPQDLYNLMYTFHNKIDNFREKLLEAIEEIDLMEDIVKIISNYEKQKQNKK